MREKVGTSEIRVLPKKINYFLMFVIKKLQKIYFLTGKSIYTVFA